MKWIVRCAGDGSRWGNFLEVPKYLAPVAGEPLLHRTIRLIGEYDSEPEILVVLPPHVELEVEGAETVTDTPSLPPVGDIDKILSGLQFADPEADTVILYGDVFYSRACMESIASTHPDRWWTWLRFGPDMKGGELFAFRFAASFIPAVEKVCWEIGEQWRAGKSVRGGWALYRALSGKPIGRHRDYKRNRTIINDRTDDFDGPANWHGWHRRHGVDPKTSAE